MAWKKLRRLALISSATNAMPAKVGRHDMKVAPQRARQMIPTTGMIETAMNQAQRRGLRVTPVGEMKP
jgi:hypothetical protein